MVTAWLWSAVTMTRVSLMLTMERAGGTLTWWWLHGCGRRWQWRGSPWCWPWRGPPPPWSPGWESPPWRAWPGSGGDPCRYARSPPAARIPPAPHQIKGIDCWARRQREERDPFPTVYSFDCLSSFLVFLLSSHKSSRAKRTPSSIVS